MRFRLAQVSAPPTPVERGYRPAGSRGADYASTSGRDYRTPPPKEGLQTTAAGPGRPEIDLVVATERWLPGLLGQIRLRVNRDAVDLERLRVGLLNLAVDHDAADLVGIVEDVQIRDRVMSASARLIDSPRAREIYNELRQGVRRGASPGFLVNDFDMVDGPDGEPGFDITRYLIFECSLTGQPRNPASRVTAIRGQFALGGGKTMTVRDLSHGPEVNHIDDPDGLSLTLGRRALKQGVGSVTQRQRLQKFFAAFDGAVERGLSRSAACEVGRDASGLGS